MNDLIEVMPFDYQIVESESGRFRVEGVFQRCDVENANKRVYPRSIWERELKNPRVVESLDKRAMFGELDHPSDGKTALKRVSHIVTGLALKEDGEVTGAAEILPTPNGQILQSLFESGVQVGISSRGSGSVQSGRVQEDFKLNTFDFVARPSTPGALPRPAGEVSKGAKTEDAANDIPDVLVTDVFDADLFNELQRELADLEEEETPNNDFNSVAREVIGLHNAVSDMDSVTPEMKTGLSESVLVLGDELTRLAAESPEHRTIVMDLLKKVEECRGAIISCPINENVKEEPMDRLQFIKDRLQEVSTEADQETEDLRAELEGLSDEELIEVALEAGVIDEKDLEETEEPEPEELDAQELLDYAQELESHLEEATELIEEMATALEEADEVDDLKLKYEASLSIIQETVTQYQLLQEAVGGEEKANELMESHLQKLEAGDTMDESKTEKLDEDVETIEELLNDEKIDETMVRYKELAEDVLDRQGLN